MYFNHCKTAEEVKAAYKNQVKALHPDNNPGRDTTADFQAMQADFVLPFYVRNPVHQIFSKKYHFPLDVL